MKSFDFTGLPYQLMKVGGGFSEKLHRSLGEPKMIGSFSFLHFGKRLYRLGWLGLPGDLRSGEKLETLRERVEFT